MPVEIDTAEPPAVPDAAATPPARRRLVALTIAAAVALVAVSAVVMTRHDAVTADEFALFADKLDTLSAPDGSFTPYDPSRDGGYGPAPEGSWDQTGSGTWSSTVDPSWWVAVHGWTTTVSADQGRATCRAVLDWLATAGAELDLTTPGETENVSTCVSVFDTIRTSPGSASDAWSGRGTQTADGRLRYRTGVVMVTGSQPGHVVVHVMADATVANR